MPYPDGRMPGMTRSAVFVLVHGAWGGAHGFGKVRRLLHADGHEVFTPAALVMVVTLVPEEYTGRGAD